MSGSRNHCSRGNAICIAYILCVSVVLVIQHAKHMRTVARLVLHYFSTFSDYRVDFWGGGNHWTQNVFHFLYNFCLKHFSF
jgi:hypothetical protein